MGSGGASAPVQKWVRIEGATCHHGLAPSIHVGTSLHDVPERDEDDDYEEDEEEEEDDGNNDIIWGETAKDEDNEEEEEDVDDAQFVDTNPVPPKCWTWSQQAQQDEQESSLVKEILSDNKKQQKSRIEAQRTSKELAFPSDSQPSSQGEGNEPVPEEADLQDPGNKDKSAVKKVTKLNTKNKVQMKALSEAWDQCYAADKLSAQKIWGPSLASIGSPLQLRSINGTSSNWGPQEIVWWMISIHIGSLTSTSTEYWPMCPTPSSMPGKIGIQFIPGNPWRNMSLHSPTPMARR